MSWIAKALGIVTSNVTLPGWIVLAGAVLGALLVFLLLVRSEPNENPLTLLVLIGILLGGMGVGTALLREAEKSRIAAEAADLEKRATALDEAAARSGLGCLNADESLQAACEVTLFERPENVAAARGLIRARLALVDDAFTYVRERGATGLLERVAVWRRPLSLDPYGIVASVLLDQRSCTVSSCPQMAVIGNVDKITANMVENRYGTVVARYAPMWERAARNRGALTQPVRTGPFGFAIVDHDNRQPASTPEDERPPVVNLPVENATPQPAAPAAAPAAPTVGAPLPPARPPVSPSASEQLRTGRTLVPRTPVVRPPPAAPAEAPAAPAQ